MSELEKQKIMIDKAKTNANVGEVYACIAITKEQRKFGFKALKNMRLNEVALEEIEIIALRLEKANLIEKVANLEAKLEAIEAKLHRLTSVEM